MIACLFSVHNEEYYLPSFLGHVAPWVDAFIVVDDRSTDRSGEILRAEPKVSTIIKIEDGEWDEALNRQILLSKAQELGTEWVLSIDPDERLQLSFLEEIRRIAVTNKIDNVDYRLSMRELWNNPLTYRCDGIWGAKARTILFKLPEKLDFTVLKLLHGPWYPGRAAVQHLPFSAYHLKMIKAKDRIGRWQRYKTLDPECKYQRDYDYLIDESGLELRAVRRNESYDVRYLPEDLFTEAAKDV
jgi:glycosyltransferase involved in cell wall biosynthesis